MTAKHPQPPRHGKQKQMTSNKNVSTQDHRKIALQLPEISLHKGYFGQITRYVFGVGNVGTQLEVLDLWESPQRVYNRCKTSKHAEELLAI